MGLYPVITYVYLPQFDKTVTVIPVEMFGDIVKLPDGRVLVPARIVFKVFAAGGLYAPQGFVLGEVDPLNEGDLTPEAVMQRVIEIASAYYDCWMWN